MEIFIPLVEAMTAYIWFLIFFKAIKFVVAIGLVIAVCIGFIMFIRFVERK